ncbi:MAG: SGNH/GDSL hydrolase family protein [Flavobacteriaceae bacterium]
MKKKILFIQFIVFIFFLNCTVKEKPSYSYLALGDSYTIGESVNENDRWPVQLSKKLNSIGIAFSAPEIIAKTGWTTDELKTGIDNQILNYPYDWVSLMIGVNNQYRNRPIENFKEEFETLIDLALSFNGNNKKRLFVLSIPDWGKMPFAKNRNQEQISREIDDFNQVIYEICALKEVLFIDITPLSRRVENHPEWIGSDGLHPSGLQYTEWVNEILTHIEPLVADE